MCEKVDPCTPRSSQVACASDIYIYIYIYDRENHKRSYEGQIKGSYLVGKLQRERGPAQISDQIHGKVSLTEAPKNTHQ